MDAVPPLTDAAQVFPPFHRRLVNSSPAAFAAAPAPTLSAASPSNAPAKKKPESTKGQTRKK
mgnify:CR=1 FL=1